jgi:hypothetical protein
MYPRCSGVCICNTRRRKRPAYTCPVYGGGEGKLCVCVCVCECEWVCRGWGGVCVCVCTRVTGNSSTEESKKTNNNKTKESQSKSHTHLVNDAGLHFGAVFVVVLQEHLVVPTDCVSLRDACPRNFVPSASRRSVHECLQVRMRVSSMEHVLSLLLSVSWNIYAQTHTHSLSPPTFILLSFSSRRTNTRNTRRAVKDAKKKKHGTPTRGQFLYQESCDSPALPSPPVGQDHESLPWCATTYCRTTRPSA